MKKLITIAAFGAVLAISGCSKGDDKTTDSGVVKREAGSWKTDIKLVKFEMPGIPDEMKSGMKQMMEGASGMEQCFTQEQVDKEDIAAELAKGSGSGECKWSKQNVAGGSIDIAGTCQANGQTIDMTMAGTMASTKQDVTMTMNGAVPTGGNMEMVMQITSTHVGPCKAGTTT
ncbi:MAG TPA: DUF3617 domain-containing protein [Sphingopyxis sp.]|nr:DUF3617 domain-containing protein [Sphingopyxis sp.]HMP46268.1 DUF3617 domain-containing protein [Sphingopyxis sp.]HMQ18651.1 DUF3617 domain-containing protein [Sphingopyxis sp.]